MTFLFAPMEGLTGRVYRRVHARFYPGIARYYVPFFSPTGDGALPKRGLTELLPEENAGLTAVPQLLTNRAEDFIAAACFLADRGYSEINLNLGCPSGTVTAKRKGAALLREPQLLEPLLDGIFSASALSGLQISVKTRIGFSDPDEFPALAERFSRYPLASLIIHPRVRAEYYTGPVHPEAFRTAQACCRFPLVWNGDIFSAGDYRAFRTAFPDADTLMLGRGLIGDPGLHRRLEGGEAADPARFRAFHDTLCEEYRSILFGDTQLCHKMKEFWSYAIAHYDDPGTYWKRLSKAKNLSEYRLATDAIFSELAWLPELRRDRPPFTGGFPAVTSSSTGP